MRYFKIGIGLSILIDNGFTETYWENNSCSEDDLLIRIDKMVERLKEFIKENGSDMK